MTIQGLEPIFEFRCPIHGNIKFNERERQIIDHPFFQRLRHISQLGFASYVYTGAVHSRFGHSLGVMHLAGRVFDSITQTEDHWISDLFTPEDLTYFRHILRIAALLHDVGHAPFSHSSERILPLKRYLNLPRSWYQQIDIEEKASHEDFSVAIVYALSEEEPALLSSAEAQDICSLIDHSIQESEYFKTRCQIAHDPSRNIHPLLKRLISGEIDVDRMDYLHRDSHYAGVNYGKYDMDRLIQGLSCTQTSEGIVPVLNHRAIYTYENFLLARLHMFLQVYFHKTLLPFDYYLQQAFVEQEIDLQVTGELDNFLQIRDDLVHSALWNARDRKWSSRIVLRKPAKRVFQFEHYYPPELGQEMVSLLEKEGIEYLFLRSTGYLSKFSSYRHSDGLSTLLVKNTILGKDVYLPVQQISLLLEQYQQNADLQQLYCEPEDYQRAKEILFPLLEQKKIIPKD